MQSEQIRLKNFEEQIDPAICKRGYDYYCEGRIKSIYRISPVEWQAVVQGFDDYKISLKTKKEIIESYSCTCSDFNENIDRACKHLAAVFYFIREEGELALLHYGDGFEEIRESLNYLPAHVLRYLMLKYAVENKNFKKYLQDYFTSQK